MNFNSKGVGEDEEERVLDMARIVVPSLLAGLLLMGILIYVIRLCYKKYQKRYPADSETNQFGDIESLTEGNVGESGGFGGIDLTFTTTTGLSLANSRNSSQRSTISSQGSFFSIVEDINERTRSPTGPVYSISRGAQTERDPAPQIPQRNPHMIRNSDYYDNRSVYTITGIGRELGEVLPQDPRPELLECFNDARFPAFDKPDLGRPKPTSEHPLMHFDSFKTFAECAGTGRKEPLPILKPILDTMSSSSRYPIQGTSNSSPKGKRKITHLNRAQKAVGSSFGGEPPTKIGKKVASHQVKNHLEEEKMRLEEELELTGHCNFQKLIVNSESLNHINLLDKILLDEQSSRLPEGPRLAEGVIKNCIQFLQEFQILPNKKTQSIRLAQQLLHHRPETRKKGLIIGVDATPVHFAGYCVNLGDKTIEFYIIKAKDSPWPMEEPMNSSEFEMKNFRFALNLWHEKIKTFKTIAVYTDNHALWEVKFNKNERNKHGLPALKMVEHFVQCENVVVINSRMCVNRMKDLASFAKFIQPADDLSRMELESSLEFLCEQYSIPKENVKGTHLRKQNTRELQKTPFYGESLSEVQTFLHSLTCEHRNVDHHLDDLSSKENHPPPRSKQGKPDLPSSSTDRHHAPLQIRHRRRKKKKQSRALRPRTAAHRKNEE